MEQIDPAADRPTFGANDADARGADRGAQAWGEAGSALREEINKCLEEFRSVSDEQLPEVRRRLNALLAEAQRTGNAYYDSVRHSSSRLASAASRELQHSCAATEAYVQEKPWQALAVVGAVSFISGLLCRRR